jgi:hypothetical protein
MHSMQLQTHTHIMLVDGVQCAQCHQLVSKISKVRGGFYLEDRKARPRKSAHCGHWHLHRQVNCGREGFAQSHLGHTKCELKWFCISCRTVKTIDCTIVTIVFDQSTWTDSLGGFSTSRIYLYRIQKWGKKMEDLCPTSHTLEVPFAGSLCREMCQPDN